MITFHINISKCLNINRLTICLWFLLIIKVCSHIGEPCNSLLKICLPISTHMYCDEQNICRCKKEYPVVVGAHSCREARRVGDRCSHPEECSHSDPNSYCTQTPYSSQCECNESFVYDKSQRLCVSESKPRVPSNTALMITTAAGIFIVCFSLLCCCVVRHKLCKKQHFSHRSEHQLCSDRTRRQTRNPTETTRQSCLNRRNVANVGLNESQNSTHLPPYESALILHDEPPPTYEDAIKDSQIASSSETSVGTKA